MRALSALFLLLWLTPATAAESLQCIQHPKRAKACPHLLYRSAQFAEMSAPAIVCICASDFNALLKQPTTEAEKVRWNMTKRQMEVIYGNNLQGILDILQRKN
ncbi:hypothetical protein [Rheinheimera baltica]|uniref:Secreted protein n=1 Tax=Rheinheimera baltica TaxID=67576 RepID=A0ABT9I3A5_9GAMM|nr:hypothetical protein [Rheinheimera baltica]MDP5137643.1 hypothetical protein [Rheinheimera baltica]MDP5191838.1 hypothetical protein [Rheinheimera baltica]